MKRKKMCTHTHTHTKPMHIRECLERYTYKCTHRHEYARCKGACTATSKGAVIHSSMPLCFVCTRWSLLYFDVEQHEICCDMVRALA